MRFLENGPSIPDELLVARDEGRVVFFCGAGVSHARAGLLDFFGLAQKVIEELGVASDSPTRKIIGEAREVESKTGVTGLISADRIFGLLERDFSIGDIQAAVAKALKPTPPVDLSAHRIVLDLARGPDARVRLITTNFDLLFESCGTTLRSWIPPRLPNLQDYDELEGIIHLHGRVNEKYGGADGEGFVLSSSEFGRAYLSDGWATQFIRSILDRYFVVFVGYTADDPPVQYLLEALNRTPGSREGVYAFQAGSMSDAEARWLHKGVRPIAYDGGGAHQSLWDSLTAWGVRARDPKAWYEDVIVRARKGPEALLPYERGQVAHVVSTIEGMRQFSASAEVPPADWLCVFDPSVRYSKPGHLWTSTEKGPYFDPFTAYGLDNDPVPPPIAPDDYYAKRDVPDGVWDGLAATRLDRQSLREDHFPVFRGYRALHVPRLPARLEHLGTWLGWVTNQPAALWWASGQAGIHPGIQDQIRIELERTKETVSQEMRRAWRYLFEAWETRRRQHDRDQYHLLTSIKRDGWTDAAVRELGRALRPYLTVERPASRNPKPPGKNRETIRLQTMVSVDVEYPHVDRYDLPPDQYVAPVVRELRKNLEHAVALETEVGRYRFHDVCPIEPDPDMEGESAARGRGLPSALLFYVHFFKRLVDVYPDMAKQECRAWRIDDDNLFARLRIWVCGDQRLFSGREAGKRICSLNDRVLWDGHHQRDLLLVLAKRWVDFSSDARTQIEQRLLKGPPRWDDEDETEYTRRSAFASLNRIHWLDAHGCRFGFDLDAESARLRKIAPEWKPSYAKKAAGSMEPWGGSVQTDTEYAALLTVPLADLLSKAAEMSGRVQGKLLERNPFAGLASERPVRALAALTNSARRNVYPEWAWRTFLAAESRKTDKPMFTALITARIARLPAGVLAQLIHPVSFYLLISSNVLLKTFLKQFDQVWTAAITVLRDTPDCAASSIVRTSEGPEWVTEALNAPVGNLTQALLNDPQLEGMEPGKGLPSSWTRRADELLTLEGDLRRHALVTFSRSLNWFFANDPSWTERNLIPALDGEGGDHDAAWAGFFQTAEVPHTEFYLVLKPRFLRLTKRQSTTWRRHAGVLAGMLLAGWGSVDEATGQRCVTNKELREILVAADDELRTHALWQLESWSSRDEDGEASWREKVAVFLTEVWPKHKKAKTPKTTSRLWDLAFSGEAAFPGLIDIIIPLVTKSGRENLSLRELTDPEIKLVETYPEKALALLLAVLPDAVAEWPYGIEGVLERIGLADPSLLKDPRLVELKHRWNAR